MTERRPPFPAGKPAGSLDQGAASNSSCAARKPVRWPAEALWEAVVPVLPGFTVEVLPEVDSTNSELMRRAHAGQWEPVLLVAERQTAGRGRLGRQWHSGADTDNAARRDTHSDVNGDVHGVIAATPADQGLPSLTFSLGLLLSPQEWSGLSLAVGLSLVDSLHPALQLKWPNDIWWQSRKLAGVLIETVSAGDKRYVVIGVGINIAPRSGAGLSTPPAALAELLPGVDAPQALQRLLLPLVQAVLRFAQQGFAPLQQSFHARDALAGKEVLCSDGVQGSARGVDACGALLVHTANGVKKVASAEVSVRIDPAGVLAAPLAAPLP